MGELKHGRTCVFNINYHIVWSTKYRRKVLTPNIDNRLKEILINVGKSKGFEIAKIEVGTEDHVHVLLMFAKTETIAHIVEEMKRNSSRWVKSLSPRYEKFAWQGGYAAFSVSQSKVETVVNYIGNQKEHHKRQSFHDEYLQFLKLYGIEYDEKYVLSD